MGLALEMPVGRMSVPGESGGCAVSQGLGVLPGVVRICHSGVTVTSMTTCRSLTVRLPEDLIERLDAESRERGVTRSDVVRDRLEMETEWSRPASALDSIDDLIGSIDGLPADMSARRKHYLKASGYGRKFPR